MNPTVSRLVFQIGRFLNWTVNLYSGLPVWGKYASAVLLVLALLWVILFPVASFVLWLGGMILLLASKLLFLLSNKLILSLVVIGAGIFLWKRYPQVRRKIKSKFTSPPRQRQTVVSQQVPIKSEPATPIAITDETQNIGNLVCSSCGVINKPGAKFCNGCGRTIANSGTPSHINR